MVSLVLPKTAPKQDGHSDDYATCRFSIVQELGRCFIIMIVTLLWMMLGIFVIDRVDPKASSCGHLTPLYRYRYINHVRPYLRSIVTLVVLAMMTLSLICYFYRLRWHKLFSEPLWRPIFRFALIIIGLAAAVDMASYSVREDYPMCTIHHQSRAEIALSDSSAVLWRGDFTPPICSNCTPGQQIDTTILTEGDFYPPHTNLDVMMVAVKPTCINNASVYHILHHLNPRRVLIATPGRHCAYFEAYHEKVHCIPEETIVPGINHKTLDVYFEKRQVNMPNFRGRSLAGWYLQQFCKLLFWTRVPDLSPHFLIWDSDMIMTKHYRLFNSHGQLRQHSGGTYVYSYAESFYKLTGLKMKFGQYWESYVVHHQPMYKPYLFEMLRAMGLTLDQDPVQWIYDVLDTIPDDEIDKGISEYNMYVTWVLAKHKRSMAIQPSHQWSRYAPSSAMPSKGSGTCCPKFELIEKASQGHSWEFFGYELGHLPFCHYNDPKYKDHYP
eukprot:TRINITY_DN8218_c0_g1_i1.p2 TRINITY_DN8218_c0_g1~~TRINITY_DN8218_c0_g1_i1.p2  ORF type:complete len:496 (+),score=67.58 TRINITY_DN8218_c0_g1_i1:1968-3455(+)